MFAVTPDRRRVCMTLEDGAVADMWLVDAANPSILPRGVAAGSAELFSNSVRGDLSPVELAYVATHGAALEAWSNGGRHGAIPPFRWPAPAATPMLPTGAVKDGNVLVPVGKLSVGDPVELATVTHVKLGKFLLFEVGGEIVIVVGEDLMISDLNIT